MPYTRSHKKHTEMMPRKINEPTDDNKLKKQNPFEKSQGTEEGGFKSEERQLRSPADEVNNGGSMVETSSKDDKNPTRYTEEEIREAVQNLDEASQVMEVICEIEDNFGNEKRVLNQCDLNNLECHITSSTLFECYHIVSGLMSKDSPDFDEDKMAATLLDIKAKVQNVYSDYN